MSDRYLAGVATLRLPEEEPPPAKTKILLLSPYGILSIGPWDSWFLAWAPLPKIPPHIKDRMRLKHDTRSEGKKQNQGDSEEA
jgi:hypothetical protein